MRFSCVCFNLLIFFFFSLLWLYLINWPLNERHKKTVYFFIFPIVSCWICFSLNMRMLNSLNLINYCGDWVDNCHYTFDRIDLFWPLLCRCWFDLIIIFFFMPSWFAIYKFKIDNVWDLQCIGGAEFIEFGVRAWRTIFVALFVCHFAAHC